MLAYCIHELIRQTVLYLAPPRYRMNLVNALFVHVISVTWDSEKIRQIFWINEQAGNVVYNITMHYWRTRCLRVQLSEGKNGQYGGCD